MGKPNKAKGKTVASPKPTSQIPIAETPAAKKQNTWVAWLALAIAILGGIPGLISTTNYFKRSSLAVNFNEAQSFACGLQTDDARLTNKLAIVLYQINITGTGSQPTFAREMRIEARINNEWITGNHITPKLFNDTNRVGSVGKAIHVETKRITPPFVTVTKMVLEDWNERWNEIGASLQYGQPLNFSYAAFFNVEPSQFPNCDQIKLVVTDYLGHEYTTLVKPTALMKQIVSNSFLVLDGE